MKAKQLLPLIMGIISLALYVVASFLRIAPTLFSLYHLFLVFSLLVCLASVIRKHQRGLVIASVIVLILNHLVQYFYALRFFQYDLLFWQHIWTDWPMILLCAFALWCLAFRPKNQKLQRVVAVILPVAGIVCALVTHAGLINVLSVVSGFAAFFFLLFSGELTSEGKGGFFSVNATCSICGKETGLNRYKMGKTTSGDTIWQCADCARLYKGQLIKIDYETGKTEILAGRDTEFRMKCNVCGHVYCYTYEDMARNRDLAKSAIAGNAWSITEAVAGTMTGAQLAAMRADQKAGAIVDYTRCPKCHSADVRQMADNEERTDATPTPQPTPSSTSEADELKKYKELLDMGAITQEEYDTKKKQLLGL